MAVYGFCAPRFTTGGYGGVGAHWNMPPSVLLFITAVCYIVRDLHCVAGFRRAIQAVVCDVVGVRLWDTYRGWARCRWMVNFGCATGVDTTVFITGRTVGARRAGVYREPR